jgi:hypothetical protein
MPAHVSPCHAVLTRLLKMQVNRIICVFDSRQLHTKMLVRAASSGQFSFSPLAGVGILGCVVLFDHPIGQKRQNSSEHEVFEVGGFAVLGEGGP